MVWCRIFSGDSSQWTALRTVSLAGTATTLLFLAHNRWMWSWPAIRFFTNKPNLNGTWRGELRSDSVRDGKRIDPIPAVIRVKQTNSSIQVTLFTGESSSVSELSELKKQEDDRWRVLFTYTNKPRREVSSRSEQHQGLCELFVTGNNDSLGGTYFTSRKTKGEMSFSEWHKTKYSDAASALASQDFSSAQPFVRA